MNVQDAMKAGGVLKGILWHQGEEDCTPENAPRYGKDLEAMVDQIRKAVGDPDLPFLVGQMSPEGINSREKQMVNDVHKNLSESSTKLRIHRYDWFAKCRSS